MNPSGKTGLLHITVIGLHGKHKRAGQEKTAEDAGLVQIILGRILVRDLAIQLRGHLVEPRLLQVYSTVISFESQFPAEATKLQLQGVTDSVPIVDAAWMGSVPERDALFKELLHDLYEGEFNESLALTISTKGMIDPMPLIEASEPLHALWERVEAAFAEQPAESECSRQKNELNPSQESASQDLFPTSLMPLLGGDVDSSDVTKDDKI